MIAESADIKLACSQCGQRIVVDKSAAGMHSNCPICEGPVTVPNVTSVIERKSNGSSAPAGRENYGIPGWKTPARSCFPRPWSLAGLVASWMKPTLRSSG